MWVMVMFDLPVVSADDRKQATEFRNRLLDLGFEMVQFSVYARRADSTSRSGCYLQEIEAALPEGGKVQMIEFTDRQYERIRSFKGRNKCKSKLTVDQLDLF
jgi:CRISPR-associated protein Cas2